MNPELEAALEGVENPLEMLFIGLIFYMVEVLFKIIEVVVEFGENTQVTD